MDLYEQDVTCGAEDVGIMAMTETQGLMSVTVAECPFDGAVEVRFHDGQWDWTCPLCGASHEGVEAKDGGPA